MRSAPSKIAVPFGLILVLLVLLVGAFLGPPLWKGYLDALAKRSAPLYLPRERVVGGNGAAAPRVAPGLEKLDARALEEAAAYAGAHASRALIVSRHDHIVFERYWQGTGFGTLIDAQSFTPLLAALATGVAVSHRRIAWPDEPTGILISEWRDDPRGAITIRNLLHMASGLAPDDPPAGADLTRSLLERAQLAPPGTVRRVQAADPQLLALALERATHARYAEFLSGTLWRSIGAADAWLWLDRPEGLAHADCCLLAAQGDWIRIGQLLLHDGNYRGDELIRPGWVSLMRSPSRSDPDYGAFVRLATHAPPGREPYPTRDVYVVGGTGGNRLWLVPSMDIAILCTGVAAGRPGDWDDARIPNLIVRGARDYLPPAALPGADLSAIVPGH
jgi:CubicO group peptidase (beta-lactamase class C family)